MKLNALLCEAEFLERTTWQLRPRMLCMVYPCRQLVAMKTEPDISGKANRHDKFDNWSCFVRRQWLSVDNDWGKWLLCTRQLPSCIKVISSVLGALYSLFTQHMQFCLIALTRSCKYSKTPFWAQWIIIKSRQAVACDMTSFTVFRLCFLFVVSVLIANGCAAQRPRWSGIGWRLVAQIVAFSLDFDQPLQYFRETKCSAKFMTALAWPNSPMLWWKFLISFPCLLLKGRI